MIRFTHYQDVVVRDTGISHAIHARLLTAVHHAIAQGETLAVSWPDWNDRPGHFGVFFRVFGNEKALADFAQSVNVLSVHELVRLLPISPVPNTARHVIFFRDRRGDRLSPSATERMKCRASAAGRTFQGKDAGRNGVTHFLPMQSATNKMEYAMAIRRIKMGEARHGNGGFGLGLQVPDF